MLVDSSERGLNEAKNNKGSKGYRDYIISQIGDLETLKSTANNENVREDSRDPETPDYTVEKDPIFNIAPIEKSGNSDPIKFNEMNRFCHEIQIDEAEIRANKGLRKVAKIDSPADETPQ